MEDNENIELYELIEFNQYKMCAIDFKTGIIVLVPYDTYKKTSHHKQLRIKAKTKAYTIIKNILNDRKS